MKNLTAIVLIIVSIGVFYMFIGPTYTEIKTQLAVKQQYDDALSRSQKVIGLRDELLNKYNGFSEENRGRLEKLLPPYIDNIRMIIEMDRLASQSGLSIKNLNAPTDITVPGEKKTTSKKEVLSVPTPTSVEASSLTFTVTTTYDKYFEFLRVMEGSLRLFDITGISFKSPDPKTGLSDFTTTFDTYSFK